MKKINFDGKLRLNKETVTLLTKSQMMNIRGASGTPACITVGDTDCMSDGPDCHSQDPNCNSGPAQCNTTTTFGNTTVASLDYGYTCPATVCNCNPSGTFWTDNPGVHDCCA